MTDLRNSRYVPALALLCAVAACSSSSTPNLARSLCRDGIDNGINVELDDLDKTLPLDVRACVQTRPCLTGHTTGRDTYGQGGVGFYFTLDDRHQQITVPVTITITSRGRVITPEQTLRIRLLQDFETDASTNKTSNCGGRIDIAVSKQGKLRVVPHS